VKVHEGKLEGLHLPAEKFDLVFLIDTIEHLINPLNTLKEINRILIKKGILIISAPDYNSLSRLFLRKSWAVLSPAEHLSSFTQKSLVHILQKADFCVLGIRNLLQFNPEYTHNKKRLSYFLFKNIYKRLKGLKIIKKTQLFEYADIMATEEKNQIKTQNTYYCLSLIAKMKRIIYKWIKTWLRGDILVAIAKKNIASSQSEIVYFPYKQVCGTDFQDINYRVPNIEKLRTYIKFEPNADLDRILKKIVDFKRKMNRSR